MMMSLPQVFVMVPALVGVFCCIVPCAAEEHLITATGSRWIYRDFRSGAGESQPVRIQAQVNDVIEFRQSDGRHGVFFYTTPRGQSELGRRVIVDRNFEPLDGQKLERISNRLFRRENLGTAEYQGARRILRIRIRGEFNRPIYFGCRVHSVLNRNAMFGVIVPGPAATAATK